MESEPNVVIIVTISLDRATAMDWLDRFGNGTSKNISVVMETPAGAPSPCSCRTHIEDPYLLLEEVAELTRIEPSTLQMYRAAGTGPPFFRQGRWLKCRRSKVLAWMESFEPDDERARWRE